MTGARVETVELTPKHWPVLEKLFGKNGACSGCWCMFWRLEKDERYADVKGAEAKQRFKSLVERGEARGILAFLDGEAVGWVTLGPRRSFPRLDRAPSLKCDDADDVWSVPCFFVHKDHRGQGIATVLLKAAVDAMRQKGAKIAEGYPLKPPPGPARTSNAAAYTGTLPLFLKQGFEVAAVRPSGKQRVRRTLGRTARKKPLGGG